MKSTLLNNLNSYKQKYYKALLLRGIIYTLLFVATFLFIGAFLEYSFWFDSLVRGVILFSFIILFCAISFRTVIIPALFLTGKSRGISNENAARHIGKHYNDLGDKLLNYVQLINLEGSNELVSASVEQRSRIINTLTFSEAINYKAYIKIWPYLLFVLTVIFSISLWKPELILDSTKRIANFNHAYTPSALFNISISNNDLIGYKNENFKLEVVTTGSTFPDEMYILLDNRKVKMNKTNPDHFTYEFISLQKNISFQLITSGVSSQEYTLKVIARPSLKSFNVKLQYPPYTKLGQETLSGINNIEVPIGTQVQWQLSTNYTDSISVYKLGTRASETTQSVDNQLYIYQYVASKSTIHNVRLHNDNSENGETITHSTDVINDQYPKLVANTYQDTTLFSFVIFNGRISDDYGIEHFYLNYKSNDQDTYSRVKIHITEDPSQSFYYKWNTLDLLKDNNSEVKYFLEVFDNDGFHGSKSTRSTIMTFNIPDKATTNEIINKSEKQAKENINSALEQAKELEENIDEAEKTLKGKKELTWKDKNKLKAIIEKKEAINKAIEKMQEENKKSSLQKERFTKQQDRLKEKAQQLQKLMDELLDEETKKLYDELKKLLEEQKDISKVQEKLNQLNNKEKNLEKELERALELFKRIQLEQKIEDTINDIEKVTKDQDKTSTDLIDKENSIEDLAKQQEENNKNTNSLEKKVEELNELNQNLKNPESIPDTEKDFEQIQQSSEESSEELKKGKRKKAAEKQKQAADQMKALGKKMQKMQGSMQMEMMQENLDNLRDVVHSLIKLSFDQESLMDNFRGVDQSDPRFVEMSQTQIKLKDDAKILEDSLLSLASRVFQISSFVTREVTDMNQYMDESSTAIKERRKDQVVSKQQFAMTSMNNLALLLDDVLQQMQQQMADAMGKPQSGEKNGKDQPGMSELQKSLNDKIKNLKKGNKQGRQLSEELAELASEQEQLRKALQELQQKSNNSSGENKSINEILKKMEETEIDLVNKNITSETIKRQEEILSRLLESESALREQDEDEQREADQATNYEDFVPRAFEEYIKDKEKEIELLKSVPPRLFPHYKNEVNEYFERVNKKPNN